jgi:acetyl esterase/lipase
MFRFLFLLCFLYSCTKSSTQQTDLRPPLNPVDTIKPDSIGTSKPPLEALEFIDQSYGDDPQQKIDIYLPYGRTTDTTRIMVFIHGGGWMGSDKIEYTDNINGLKKLNANFAYVNINYRLVKDGKNQFPAAEEDVKTAMEYVWQHADSFHISKRTAIIGVSAGAHLAALESYKHNDSSNVKAVVLFFGVYDMKEFYEQGSAGVPALTAGVVGGTPEEKPDLYHSSSALYYVNEKSPATFISHGRQDSLSRYHQSEALDSVLQLHGVHRTHFWFDGWHGIPSARAGEAADSMFKFIAKFTASPF